jgi:preprotein translocase subunit SecY
VFKTLKNAWKIPELKKKILYTLLLLAIFRFGTFITAPGVNASILRQLVEANSSSFLETINIITGGAFANLSIFAMSISPYITASIIIQLLTIAIPSLERLQKEGEEGKKKLTRYTKYTSVVLAAVEAFGLYITYRGQGVFLAEGFLVPLLFVLTLTAGSTFLMWLGDQITAKGIGNGISLLIFAGIISGLPSAAAYIDALTFQNGAFRVFTWLGLLIACIIPGGSGVSELTTHAATFASSFSLIGFLTAIGIVIGAIILIAGVVWVTEAERRVPVQYAKRVVGRKMYGGQNTHIPMKLAMAGVLPIIFAMSFMQFPAMIIQLINPNIATSTGFWNKLYYVFAFSTLRGNASMWMYGLIHSLIYLLLIVGFTFFYTLMVFNPIEVSNNLKKNGGFIPGIRAGRPTSDYLKGILSYITWFGALFLGLVAIIPILAQFSGLQISFGGTAILIIVGVALESIKQLEAQMLTRHYKGFLE